MTSYEKKCYSSSGSTLEVAVILKLFYLCNDFFSLAALALASVENKGKVQTTTTAVVVKDTQSTSIKNYTILLFIIAACCCCLPFKFLESGWICVSALCEAKTLFLIKHSSGPSFRLLFLACAFALALALLSP
jgi:hypothetical protein